ncbi:MAG TPA: 5'-deoxynucleotidase [Clostridia bacterium]|jgi:5'-deoxynucleotidase|nr:5'-deoxynucleotidase [Clostridia bacterium]HOK82430.1 5'-deoxynucleotidase [Clostridia bacterium]HOL61556.1 5'-deoxynucleotidase [Clostridia bacterium]HPO54144.1 5'-deoxynucleotidase [Clostridia bacterium]
MGYNFFAYLSRMKFIKRWSLMHSGVNENVMEHSEQVAQLAHALATINNKIFGGTADVGKCVSLAVFHEAGEVITGDLPTPIKYFNNEIKTAFKGLEAVANEKLLTMLPKEFQDGYRELLSPDTSSYEYKLVKAADKLAAYVKCVEEVKAGNKEFSKALKSISKELDQNALPEVRYFMSNFISGFEKTLDELD